MKGRVQTYVRNCLTCHRRKATHLQPVELLQSLPVTIHVWSDLSMDFITNLPKSQGEDVIVGVVDRFSKYVRFFTYSHPYSVISIARLFFHNIFKLHGLQESIVSDRDPTFMSTFLSKLFCLCGTKLSFSSDYHS